MFDLKSSTAPKADRRSHKVELHGISRDDPYQWMKAENWQEVMQSPNLLPDDIRAYLEAENSYSEAVLKPTEAFQEQLLKEIRGRINEDDSSVPSKHGDFDYYIKFVEGGQYPKTCRRKHGDESGDSETILFDGDVEAEGFSYFAGGAAGHSPDHKLLATAIDTKGSEFYELNVREIASGDLVTPSIESATGDCEFSSDGRFLFYTLQDDNHRPNKVFVRDLKSDDPTDHLIYEEMDPGYFLGLSKSESERFLFVSCFQHDTSEVHVLDLEKFDGTEANLALISARQAGVEYSLSHRGKHFVIVTNRNGAADFKITTAPIDDPSPDNWRDLVAHQPGTFIVALYVLAGHIVRLVRERALPKIIVTDMSNGEEHEVAFDEEAYSLGLIPGYEFETTEIRFNYSSPTTPGQVFDYDVATKERRLRKEQVIPSGHDASRYEVLRLFSKSHDGAEVPVTLLRLKSLADKGPQPTHIYGYGSYGSSMPAGFNGNILSLVDRGVTYVTAHVRGGSELGDGWYKQGRKALKPNTFKDFVAVAEDLIARDLASKGDITAQGGSAGGLLMGAVVNMRPDLFNGIVAQVPFVDVLTTMSDTSLPLTPIEWPEWGNPIESEEDYQTIAAYSPIENVQKKRYPAMLITGGLTDPRVTYWEPAKWAATLRHRVSGTGPILLKMNMDAGHAGASGRFERLKEVALSYAFVLTVHKKS